MDGLGSQNSGGLGKIGWLLLLKLACRAYTKRVASY
jgi:hypothetical protein